MLEVDASNAVASQGTDAYVYKSLIHTYSIRLLQLQPHDDSHASLKGELVEGRLEDNLGDHAQVSSKAFIH